MNGGDPSEDGSRIRRPNLIVAEEEDSEEESEYIEFREESGKGNGVSVPPSIMSNGSISLGDSQYSWMNATHHTNGDGSVAFRRDLNMPANEFAEGCKLLQASALGKKVDMEAILQKRPRFVEFRDYDRRTAMHVAASEGHLEVCKFLVKRGARINRSDRWGGSPLDDAQRHRHKEVAQYLRALGATTGSASRATNFIKAAAEGDADEVEMLLMTGEVDVNEGDYDKRTALHLAAGEGNVAIVRLLCKHKANVNIEDRWGNRPLDDAVTGKQKECAELLKEHGAKHGFRKAELGDSTNRRREIANLEVKFEDLEMVDKLGKGSFGEIYRYDTIIFDAMNAKAFCHSFRKRHLNFFLLLVS
jgi:ankyrin repeat protein